jgi:hypothetical protein
MVSKEIYLTVSFFSKLLYVILPKGSGNLLLRFAKMIYHLGSADSRLQFPITFSNSRSSTVSHLNHLKQNKIQRMNLILLWINILQKTSIKDWNKKLKGVFWSIIEADSRSRLEWVHCHNEQIKAQILVPTGKFASKSSQF